MIKPPKTATGKNFKRELTIGAGRENSLSGGKAQHDRR
jgi:hypothetical protein